MTAKEKKQIEKQLKDLSFKDLVTKIKRFGGVVTGKVKEITLTEEYFTVEAEDGNFHEFEWWELSKSGKQVLQEQEEEERAAKEEEDAKQDRIQELWEKSAEVREYRNLTENNW